MPRLLPRLGWRGLALLVASTVGLATGPAVGAAPNAQNDGSKTLGTAVPTRNIEEIRDAIQAANDRDGSGVYEGVIPYLGDKIETMHEPRFPSDGVIEGSKLAKSLPYEHRVHDAMMENRRMDVT